MLGLEEVGVVFAEAVFTVFVPALSEHLLPSHSISIKVINILPRVLEIGCRTDLVISTI